MSRLEFDNNKVKGEYKVKTIYNNAFYTKEL